MYSHLSLDIGFEDFFRGQSGTGQAGGRNCGRSGVKLPIPIEVSHSTLEDWCNKCRIRYSLAIGRWAVKIEWIDVATVTGKISTTTFNFTSFRKSENKKLVLI